MPITVKNWLAAAQKKLEQSAIPTARLDALVLLEDVAKHDRAWLLANPSHKISVHEQAKLTKLLNRRATHEPLAYVRTKSEFYGREFTITPAVLEPRPESETMIDQLKNLSKLPKIPKIADVGAGSGALGITAKLELPNARVELLDIDSKALKIAQKNVEKYATSVSTIKSNLLERSTQPNDILLCNLPYVPDGHQINQAAMHEPGLAIFGGHDGLNIYRRLFKQVKKLQKQPLFILTESLPPQHEALAKIAEDSGYKLKVVNDFIQVFAAKPQPT